MTEVLDDIEDRDPNFGQARGGGCACGCGGSIADHRSELGTSGSDDGSSEHYVDRLVETAVVRAMFPNAMLRRAFLKAVGASTALAAIAEVLPLAATKAIAQQAAALEKTKLNIGFVPITCSVPILLAHAMGEYQKEGLDVSPARTPGWAIVATSSAPASSTLPTSCWRCR